MGNNTKLFLFTFSAIFYFTYLTFLGVMVFSPGIPIYVYLLFAIIFLASFVFAIRKWFQLAALKIKEEGFEGIVTKRQIVRTLIKVLIRSI